MGRADCAEVAGSRLQLDTYDRDRSKAEQLIRHGGTVAESVADFPPV